MYGRSFKPAFIKPSSKERHVVLLGLFTAEMICDCKWAGDDDWHPWREQQSVCFQYMISTEASIQVDHRRFNNSSGSILRRAWECKWWMRWSCSQGLQDCYGRSEEVWHLDCERWFWIQEERIPVLSLWMRWSMQDNVKTNNNDDDDDMNYVRKYWRYTTLSGPLISIFPLFRRAFWTFDLLHRPLFASTHSLVESFIVNFVVRVSFTGFKESRVKSCDDQMALAK